MNSSRFSVSAAAALFVIATPLATHSAQNNCAPMGVSFVEQPDGSFAPQGYSLLPRTRPPTPTITGPESPTVVEGNLGRFLPPPGGARENYQEARFSWEFDESAFALPITLRGEDGQPETRTIYIGHTTHYDLCVYQTTPAGSVDFRSNCGREDVRLKQHTRNQVDGVWLEKVDCDQNSVAPRPGGGFADGEVGGYAQTGFKPRYPYGDESIVELEWKLRACNNTLCGAWSEPRALVWVPPPELKGIGIRNPWALYFRMSRVVSASGGGSDADDSIRARVCVAAPGESCTAHEQDVAGVIWVKSVSVPDNTGDTFFNETDANRGRTSVFWFLNGYNNWSGATCWRRKLGPSSNPDEPQEEIVQNYCVYQENYRIDEFEPNKHLPD